MDRETLRPCPFCGSAPKVVTRDTEPQYGYDATSGRPHETFVQCDCGCCLFDGDFGEGFYEQYHYESVVGSVGALSKIVDYTPGQAAIAAWNRRVEAPDAPPNP